MTPGGSESTPIAFQEAGNKRGGEEHASMGSGSAYRGEGGGPLPKRYETFTIDHDWVQWVRGSLLGLEAGAMPSKKDIDTWEHFVL